MPSDQTLIIAIFVALFGLLVWGRIRYDLVAFGALVLAAALGLVSKDAVFSGFGHSAVAIIALVLIVSRGLISSGAIEKLASRLLDAERPLPLHIAVVGVVGAGISAVINNVAALALLMPLDIWLLLSLAAGSTIAWWLAFRMLPWALDHMEPIPLLLLGVVLWTPARLCLGALTLAVALAAKWLLIGRYRPGRHPVYGWWYLRHWLVQRMVAWGPWGLLRGTELQLTLLRLFGARIGKNVFVHPGVDLRGGGWDLLEIGDGAAIGQDAAIGLCELDRGHVVLGAVDIGAGAVLEVRAGVEGGASVGAGACISALSHVPTGTTVPAGRRWDGVPATDQGPAVDHGHADQPGSTLGRWAHDLLLVGGRGLIGSLVALPALLVTMSLLRAWQVDSQATLEWWSAPQLPLPELCVFLGMVAVSIPLGVAGEALLLRWGPKVPAPGDPCGRAPFGRSRARSVTGKAARKDERQTR